MVFPDHAAPGVGDPWPSRQIPAHTQVTVEDELSTERGAWFIPRPALCRNSTTCTCNSPSPSADRQVEHSIKTVSEWLIPSSTPSSNTSTQSGTSGTLLLTAANLAALRLEQGHGHKPHDTTSLASSTHFTVVNGMWRKPRQKTADCCRACHKHQLTSVVLSVCALFLFGLCLAIYFIDKRARSKLS